MSSIYLERYAWKKRLFPDFKPSKELGQIIVLPAYKEENIIEAIESINRCKKPKCDVLILVVVNESEDASVEIRKANLDSLEELKSFSSTYPILISHQKLPKKKAGVGLARKIGMDEAVQLFHEAGGDGIIICYDADSKCDNNYLTSIERTYENHSVKSGVVFYEHNLNGCNKEEIVSYELYLRYYIDALRYTGFPYAYQTLGSCITVRCSQYEKVGGMNTRKAGEDFYFLNKTIPLSGFVEINSTTVRPSDRISDRVPFGTGKAVRDIKTMSSYEVYHPKTFEDLKLFFGKIEDYWIGNQLEIPSSIESFLGSKWHDDIEDLKRKVSSKEMFTKRFFHWFDAFKILKYVHFVRDQSHSTVPLSEALKWLEGKLEAGLGDNLEEKLLALRKFDRGWSKPNQTDL